MIFLDKHPNGCRCSYCGDGYTKPCHYGLNIPPDWRAWNAWWVIKIWPHVYIRGNHGLRWLKRRYTDIGDTR